MPKDMTTKLSADERAELRRCETTIRAHEAGFIAAGNALLTIRDQRLYRDSHESFDTYCKERWGFGKQRAYQLICGARLLEEGKHCLPLVTQITNPRQAAALAKVPEQHREAVMERAAASSPAGPDGKPKVTARAITEAAAAVAPPQPSKSKSGPSVSGEGSCGHSPAASPFEGLDDDEVTEATDGLGRSIEPGSSLDAAYAQLDRFRQIVKELRRLRKEAQELAKDESGVGAYIPAQLVDGDFQNIIAVIRMAEPYTACPYCKGRKCKAGCKSLGWVTKEVFNRAPSEMKGDAA